MSARKAFDLENRQSNKLMILEFCGETFQIKEIIQEAIGRMKNDLITEARWVYRSSL